MLYYVLILIEVALIAVISVPLMVFAPPVVSLPVIVAMILAAWFFRPAWRLSQRIRRDRRRVVRMYRPAAALDNITLRPQDKLTPAEISRLMGIIRVIPADRADVADLTATLLDLNRRGYVELSAGKGEDILNADSLRIVCRKSADRSKLTQHEQRFLRLIDAASGSASSVQLPAFREYAAHSPRSVRASIDGIRSAVDRQLRRRKLLDRITTSDRKFPHIFGKRVTVLTQRGEQACALWRSYLRSICTRPYLDSYQPNTEDLKKSFGPEALRLLIDAASCGVCAKAAGALMHEYLFDPAEIWDETQFFSSLTEARTAFSEDANGESYLFLPLREFETALRDSMGSGEISPHGK